MKITVTLLRHAKTQGNLEKRYIGRTDQPITPQGQQEVEKNVLEQRYPAAELVFSSPMERCLQTAALIYPEQKIQICEGLQETDFGTFEGKNFAEIGELPEYRQWVDSGGDATYSGGEDAEDFRLRCQAAFVTCLEQCESQAKQSASILCHGGTIMAILDQFSSPHQSFYHWQVSNGNGYQFDFAMDEKNATNIHLLW